MIQVVGGGVAGLLQALFAAERGLDVLLLEQDHVAPPESVVDAFDWTRTGVPQFRHSHAFLARMRKVIMQRLPHLYRRLLELGAREIRLTDHLPAEMEGFVPDPRDDDLVVLACRRSTLEWALAVHAEEHPHIRIRRGVRVRGLLIDRGRVGGVETDEGVSTADATVLCTGRRTPLDLWASRAGLNVPPAEREPTGIVYFTRFYRARDEPPEGAGPWAGDLHYLKYAVFPGDADHFSITFAVYSRDVALRRALASAEGFESAARVLPATSRWVSGGAGIAETDVMVMAGLDNHRRSLAPGGSPLCSGLFVVGDAHTCTNPLYGRGCTLSALQAGAVADLLARGSPAESTTVEYENFCEQEIRPWYEASVLQDRQNSLLALLALGRTTENLSESPELYTAKLLIHGLLPASRRHPRVWRLFMRAFNLLDGPGDLLADEVAAQTIADHFQANSSRDLLDSDQPSRETLLEKISA